MADVDYHYSVSQDFTSCDTPAIDRLKQEIEQSTIVTALGTGLITVVGDDCTIWFKATLSSADETTLDGIVANHDGTPLEYPTVSHVMLEPSGDPDKKLQVVSYEFEADLNGTTIELIQFSEDREIQGASIEVVNHQQGPSGDEFRLGIAAYIGGQWVEVRTLACAHDGNDLAIPPSGKVVVVAEGTASFSSSLRIAVKYVSTALAGDKPLVNILLRTWML